MTRPSDDANMPTEYISSSPSPKQERRGRALSSPACAPGMFLGFTLAETPLVGDNEHRDRRYDCLVARAQTAKPSPPLGLGVAPPSLSSRS